jgi:hypothetical protein
MIRLFVALASSLLFATSVHGAILRVDGSVGSDSGDGTSWPDAYLYLQDAIAAAQSGDELWIREGIYLPDEGGGQTNNNPLASFRITSGIALYGGFSGTETLRTERDPELHGTTVSGDIDRTDLDADGTGIAEPPAKMPSRASLRSFVTIDGATRLAVRYPRNPAALGYVGWIVEDSPDLGATGRRRGNSQLHAIGSEGAIGWATELLAEGIDARGSHFVRFAIEAIR